MAAFTTARGDPRPWPAQSQVQPSTIQDGSLSQALRQGPEGSWGLLLTAASPACGQETKHSLLTPAVPLLGLSLHLSDFARSQRGCLSAGLPWV